MCGQTHWSVCAVTHLCLHPPGITALYPSGVGVAQQLVGKVIPPPPLASLGSHVLLLGPAA